jgi:hypothetical protein
LNVRQQNIAFVGSSIKSLPGSFANPSLQIVWFQLTAGVIDTDPSFLSPGAYKESTKNLLTAVTQPLYHVEIASANTNAILQTSMTDAVEEHHWSRNRFARKKDFLT